MFVEWGELALLQKLMACAILNDYLWFALHRKMRLLHYRVIASIILHFSTETRASVKK